MKRVWLLTVAALICGAAMAQELTVVKGAEKRNKTLSITRWEGDAEVLAYIRHVVAVSDWFDVVADGEGSDYQLQGSHLPTGNVIEFRVYRDGRSVAAFRRESAAGDARLVVRHAVDGLIEAVYKNPGFCTAKLAMVKAIGGTKEIFEAEFDGANPRQLTHNGSLSVEPAWGRSGDLLAYTLYNTHRTDVVLMDFARGEQRRLAAFPGLNSAAALSPDGRNAALALSKDGNPELYLMDVNTRGIKRLTNTDSVESSPCWSPDGGRICFVSDGGGLRPTLYVMPANGGRAQRLIRDGSECVSPDWSAVSNRICFAMRVGGSYQIAWIDADKPEAGPEIVTDAAGDWEAPAWAPDGRHVVCSRTAGGRKGLVLLDTWYGKIIPLKKYTGDDTLPAYSQP